MTESPRKTLSAKNAASSKGTGGCVGSVVGTVGTVVGIVGRVLGTVNAVLGIIGTVVGAVRPVEITGTVGTWGIEGSVDVPGITVVEDPRKVDVPGKMVGRNTGEWVLLMLGAGVASFVCTTITTTDAHINISKQQEIQVSKINRLSDPEAGIDISATPSSYQHANTQ